MPISQETIYKEIARELFAEFPDAHWGPGHVCLEDGNWGAYEDAIERVNITLAVRSLKAIGQWVTARNIAKEATRKGWDVSMYDDHSTAELAETLAALELIKWHEEGNQGDAPKK